MSTLGGNKKSASCAGFVGSKLVSLAAVRTAAPVGPWWRACATAGQRIARRPGGGREVSIPVERVPRAGPGGLASAARYSHRPGADGPRIPKPFRSDATTARCAATGLPPSGARSHPGGRPAFFRWPRPKTRTRLSVAPRPGGAPQGATESREARRNQLSSDSGSPARAYLASIAASRASAARALASACWYSSLASSDHSNSRPLSKSRKRSRTPTGHTASDSTSLRSSSSALGPRHRL